MIENEVRMAELAAEQTVVKSDEKGGAQDAGCRIHYGIVEGDVGLRSVKYMSDFTFECFRNFRATIIALDNFGLGSISTSFIDNGLNPWVTPIEHKRRKVMIRPFSIDFDRPLVYRVTRDIPHISAEIRSRGAEMIENEVRMAELAAEQTVVKSDEKGGAQDAGL